jgi:hypothetical protein
MWRGGQRAEGRRKRESESERARRRRRRRGGGRIGSIRLVY